MYLKRHYQTPEGWEAVRDETGRVVNAPPLSHVEVRHTGSAPEQNFSRRFVETGLTEGWVSLSRGQLLIHTPQEDLTYTILAMPGTYCCHCGSKLDDDPSGVSNRQHVAEQHAGIPSPDPANPAGYRVTNAYECVLDEAQHARWNATSVAARRATGGAPPALPVHDTPTQAEEG